MRGPKRVRRGYARQGWRSAHRPPLRTAVQESNRIRGDASWVEFVRHAKAPELPVILLEDVGALTGLMFALVGVGLSAKIAVAGDDPALDVTQGINAAERRIRAAVPIARVIYLEPDLYSPDTAARGG